jgi:hypothetical protein
MRTLIVALALVAVPALVSYVKTLKKSSQFRCPFLAQTVSPMIRNPQLWQHRLEHLSIYCVDGNVGHLIISYGNERLKLSINLSFYRLYAAGLRRQPSGHAFQAD